jgi:hypothetical protein
MSRLINLIGQINKIQKLADLGGTASKNNYIISETRRLNANHEHYQNTENDEQQCRAT